VSTLGFGVDISYRQNSFVAYRLSAFTQPFDTKIKLKGIQYKTEDSSYSVGLLLDIFPFENAFRISAGAYYFKLDTVLSTSVDAINPIYEELSNQRRHGKGSHLILALVGKGLNNPNRL